MTSQTRQSLLPVQDQDKLRLDSYKQLLEQKVKLLEFQFSQEEQVNKVKNLRHNTKNDNQVHFLNEFLKLVNECKKQLETKQTKLQEQKNDLKRL